MKPKYSISIYYQWVDKTIKSCVTLSQWANSLKLIQNFETTFGYHNEPSHCELLRDTHIKQLKLLNNGKNS